MLVLAHQGGWDELLMVLTPIALFAGLLWLANRRANERAAGHAPRPPDGTVRQPAEGDPPDRPEDPGDPGDPIAPTGPAGPAR